MVGLGKLRYNILIKQETENSMRHHFKSLVFFWL